ncbi:MAG TPA: M4 family metallopeptidase [Bryobacteraceae bacterium]|nr:M4 family metallopeptidase [Bryobacteraceae bacterium]
MCQAAHRHSIFCILPPDVLSNIARRGTPDQREAAIQALNLDATLRTQRLTFNLLGGPLGTLDVSGAPPAVRRTIYDAGGTQQLPGKSVRAEGAPAGSDVEVNEAYDGLGDTFNFFLQAYERNSIDNAGLALDATVHFGKKYDNAFWNGQQMVFGDGDGVLFTRFTISLDVIGHELTHGVTGSEVNLTYQGQPGALNESVSDVFGSLVKQYKLKQTAAQADWLIGAGLLAKSVNGVALRSMKAPGTAYDDPVLGKDSQPAKMSGYVHTSQDNGGVHTNSGIPNHAFYLAATAIGGNAWEKAGQIWYDTICDKTLSHSATFSRFAGRTIAHATQRYGSSSNERKAVADAWRQVGVKVSAGAASAAG